MIALRQACKPVLRCSCHLLQKVKQTTSRQYSDWLRKRPPSSQFTADTEGVPYRTTISVNNQLEEYLQIDRYSPSGFMLNNGFRVIGPCAVFPRSILSWNVAGVEDIHTDSLSLFTILEPKLDLLLVGVGEENELDYVEMNLYKDVKELGIGLEVLPTHQACAMFNLLNSERRCIAAALIPPRKIISRDPFPDFFIEPGSDDNLFFKKPDGRIDPQTGRMYLEAAEEEKAKRLAELEERRRAVRSRAKQQTEQLKLTNKKKDNDDDDGI